VEESEDDLLDALIAENKVSANLVKKSKLLAIENTLVKLLYAIYID
jgi:hypothetical protein